MKDRWGRVVGGSRTLHPLQSPTLYLAMLLHAHLHLYHALKACISPQRRAVAVAYGCSHVSLCREKRAEIEARVETIIMEEDPTIAAIKEKWKESGRSEVRESTTCSKSCCFVLIVGPNTRSMFSMATDCNPPLCLPLLFYICIYIYISASICGVACCNRLLLTAIYLCSATCLCLAAICTIVCRE